MFRSLSGYKSNYHYLKLLVVSDFDEWKVLVEGPGVTIQGSRQFTPAKAQDHAVSIGSFSQQLSRRRQLRSRHALREDVPVQLGVRGGDRALRCGLHFIGRDYPFRAGV